MNSKSIVAIATLASAALTTFAIACQQALGIDGEVTVKPSTSSACGLPLTAGACQACLEQNCCARARACAEEAPCAAYESCVAACGESYTCRARCIVAHPVGNMKAIPALDTCAVEHCETACGIGCGAVTTLAEPDAAEACQQCLAAHDCTATEACGRDVECQGIARCVQSCTTIDCQTACLAGSDAAPKFESALLGGASTCLSACDVGRYWECVGRVSFPLAKALDYDLTIGFVDSEQRAPLAGLVVKACDNGDTACVNPLATGTTDSRGSVKLSLHREPSSAYGFSGYLDVSSPAVMPYLFFLSFPLSEPHADLSLILLTPASFQNLVSLVNVTLDGARGTIAPYANDCFLSGAPDVVFDADGVDGATQLRYLDGNFLSNTATATDRSGLAMFLNAPATAVRVHATPRAIGRVSSRVSAFVRPGAISLVPAIPSP